MRVVLDAIPRGRRPAVEYVRDVYAELMAMGEGARRPRDRSDISSDDEDEMEVRFSQSCNGSEGVSF